MLCIDNSEWSRNGDFSPTRMEAQLDAAHLVCGAKTRSSPESTVGILSLAGGSGKGVQVLCSPTGDMGKILGAIADVRIGGKADFASGMQIAQLALKHRKNKHGGQRIVVFVSSPIEADPKRLTKIAKSLKKSNIAVDIISMGESNVNREKLDEFIRAVDKNGNSHLLSVEVGMQPSDAVMTILSGEGGGSPDGILDNDDDFEMAVQMSLEEARREAEKRSKTNEESKEVGANMEDDEDALLHQALAMSMADAQQEEGGGGGGDKATASGAGEDDGEKKKKKKKGKKLLGTEFVNDLLSDLDGVDPKDPKIAAILEGEGDKDDIEKPKKKKKKKKKKEEDDGSPKKKKEDDGSPKKRKGNEGGDDEK